jgi:hypothetical protein
VTYAGFGGPALATWLATTSYGLHDTALVYCAAVAALAGAVSVLIRRHPQAHPNADRAVENLPCAPVTDDYLTRHPAPATHAAPAAPA